MFRDIHHGKPCAYCERLMDRASFQLQPTRDHIMPQVYGGRKTLTCCLKCNGIKGDMLPLNWVIFMIDNPGWWKRSKVERRTFDVSKFRSSARQGSRPMPPVIVPPELVYGALA